MKSGGVLIVFGFVVWITGCNSLPCQNLGNAETEKKGPKTLLEWNVGKKEDDKDKKDDDKEGKENEKNGEKKENGKNGDKPKENDNGENKDKESEDQEKRIDTDRPHLPESSSTVGLNRVVLESGFTYNTSGGYFPKYSYPEALVRIGMFADWFEFRIAQNVNGEYTTNTLGQRSIATGANDLQLGVKLALTEQKQWLPESCLILQMTVPSGSPGFSANRVLPGLHYDASWEVIKEKFSVETVLFADGTVDDVGHTYTLLGHGITAVYSLTKKLEAFGEIDSYYSLGESAGPQHYFVGGLVYFVTKNMEIDIRSGVGLNQHSQGYLLGTGFSIRY
ncbi:MAG TPA: transporter [Gemmata sp.]|nr:transporter [Gemmata sp.]